MSPPPDMPGLPDLTKLFASMLGSFVSLKFVQGTALERLFMFVGGASVSFYATSPLAEWIGGSGLDGLIGFFSGLLGMTVVAKLYEVVQALDAKAIATDLWAGIKRFFKLGA